VHFKIFVELVNRTFKKCSRFVSPPNTELPIKAEELLFYLIF